MADSTTFLNLVRGNSLGSYLHLEMNPGKTFRYAPDYTYIEIPVAEFYDTKEEAPVSKAMRNQKIQILPACKVSVRAGYKIMVRTNPKLQEVSNCPTIMFLDPGDNGTPSFYASFQKDYEAKELDWAVRLYLVG